MLQILLLAPLCVIHSFIIAWTTHGQVLTIWYRPVLDSPSAVRLSSAGAVHNLLMPVSIGFEGDSDTQLPHIYSEPGRVNAIARMALSGAHRINTFAESTPRGRDREDAFGYP